MDKIRRHVYIEGRVQGVGFRSSVRYKAQEFNINGWAKNLYDGRVEAIFTGFKDDVNKILKYVKHGPRFARVNSVDIREEEYRNKFNSFQIKF